MKEHLTLEHDAEEAAAALSYFGRAPSRSAKTAHELYMRKEGTFTAPTPIEETGGKSSALGGEVSGKLPPSPRRQPGGYTWANPNARNGSESEDSDMESNSGDDTDEAEARRERRAEKLRKRRIIPYQKPKEMSASQLRRRKLLELGKKHSAVPLF
jgi:hypothetical protein